MHVFSTSACLWRVRHMMNVGMLARMPVYLANVDCVAASTGRRASATLRSTESPWKKSGR